MLCRVYTGGDRIGDTTHKIGTAPNFSHGQGRPFVFTPLKRSAGRTFPPCTQHTHLCSFVAHLDECAHRGNSAALTGPAVMQKVGGRHDPHLKPLSSRISLCASPASLLLHRKILFAQNLGIVPTTDFFTHPLTMLHKPARNLFPPQAPPKSLSWFGAHGLRPCKTATKMSDTIRRPVCKMPFPAPPSHHGTNCPAFSCHTSCIQ